MKRRMSEAAKERWRKRKAAMEVVQNEGEDYIQRASLVLQNEVAEGPSHSALTTDNEQAKHSLSAAFTSKRKVSKVNNMIVRRSNRIKSFGLLGTRHGRKAVQQIDLTDSDRGKELHVEPINLKPIGGVVHAGEDNIQRASLASQNEVAAGPSYSVLTTNNMQSKHSQSAASTSKKKVSEVNNMNVRRSNRIKSIGSFGKRQGGNAVQHIDLTNCGRDKELHVEPISLKPIRGVVHTQAGSPKNSTTTNAQSKFSQAFSSKRKTLQANNMIVRQSGQLKSSRSIGKRQGKKGVHHVNPTDCDRDKELHVEPIRGVVQAQADGPKNTALTYSQSKLSQVFFSKRKTLKANNMIVRQSGQLKRLGSIGKRQGRKGIHHVDPTDCDRDKELHVESVSPEPIRNISSADMIVDHLVQTRGKRHFASEAKPTNLNYKTLYTASVKKIESLMEENHRQAQELYYKLGKVETYENMIGSVMNLSRGSVKLQPDAAALNAAPAPKSSPVKTKKKSAKRMKKN
ncbi:hypothetical protein P3S67_001050 [Capsicum chacoense]